ncbi:MSMEG_0565 family glycosyltransferase [Azohydromonas lata]|uniref:MSMEG_0565 family glycosyltransferase n=1 Tax=Azohydromonas lata TaxID=45677 RepID=UPI000835A3D3|nr:MSMEG_0565 family glycosyltransferase [Azohydromonas lata]
MEAQQQAAFEQWPATRGARYGDAMRIALLAPGVQPDGAAAHTFGLARALAARGHAVTVVAPAQAGERPFRDPGCAVALLPVPPATGCRVEQVARRIAALEQALPAVLTAGRFDLLHAQDGLNGNALATLRNHLPQLPPWVRTVHRLDALRQPLLERWQARGWLSADAVACLSEASCRQLRQQHGAQARRLHAGVDLSPFQPTARADDAAHLRALGLPDDGAPLVLALGGLQPHRNAARLLAAFASWRAARPHWAHARLVLAGDDDCSEAGAAQRAWRDALRRLGWQEGPGEPVWRCGSVPDTALPALLRRARLLALPSLAQGSGQAALEALACGTPVLLSRRAPFSELMDQAGGVSWCDPGDEDSIALGLQRAAMQPRHQRPPKVCVEHGWEHGAAAHEAWYAQVLAHRQVRRRAA